MGRLAQIRSLVLRCSIALAVVLSISGCCELSLRSCGPSQSHFYVYPPGTRVVFYPRPEVLPGVGPRSVFSINERGIRGRLPGPDGEYRVLAVGGSTTECLYLDDADAWPALVERGLGAASPARAPWVGNAGKSGMTSRDHVVTLDRLTADLPSVDVALVLVGVNDLTFALSRGPSAPPPLPITDPAAERAQLLNAFAVRPGRAQDAAGEGDPWYKRTALYQLAKSARPRPRSSVAQDARGDVYARWRAHRRSASRVLDEPADLGPALVEYRRNLHVLADVAERRGVALVLMTQPVLWREGLSPEAESLLWLGGVGNFQERPNMPYYSARALAAMMDRFNRVMLDVCAERALDCLDLAAEVPRDLSAFYDDCHFTKRGSVLVAEAVTAHLRSVSFLRRSARLDR